MWATQRSLWNLIYQTSSDNSYDSMTKVIDTLQILPSSHENMNSYCTFATSDNAIFSCEKYYCWNFLPTLLHIFARPTLANSLTNLTHRTYHGSHTNHTYQVVCSPGSLSTNPCDKTVAFESWIK